MRRRTRTQRAQFLAVATAAALSLVTACGSAVPHDKVVEAARGGLPGNSSGVTEGTTSGALPDANAGGSGSGTGAAGGSTGTGGAAAPGTGGAPAVGGGSSGNSSGSGGSTTGSAAPGSGGGAGAGDKSPIVVASVGNYSGAPGSVLKSSAIGAQIWASAVNAKGGIAGHPVQMIVADDQSDPARYRTILKDLVENKKVVAFVGSEPSTTVAAGQSYLEQVKVPVVGSGDGSPTWQNSPMHFPVAGSADALVWGNFAEAKRQGKTKIAVFACVEASSCTGWKATARKFAPKIGVEVVYDPDISITQPDFTSECLNARNRGAQVVAVIADSNTLYRVARSCGQQNFKPSFIAPAPNDVDAQKKDLEGAIGAMHTFPYFGVPGNKVADEFRAAVKKYAPNAPQQMYLATGYASGRVLEAAVLRGIGSAKPSSAGVLKGLYALPQGETLGGLVLPLRFRTGGPTKMVFCYYAAVIKGGRYVAPDGMKPTCPKV